MTAICYIIIFTQIVQKTKKASILSDSEDEVIDSKKDVKKSKTSKKNVNEKPRKEIAPGELFGKKPITRVEETKVSRKLRKLVNIVYK